ncbi:hypothetical protein GYMLUDRAFT_178191 [Collybiopsis luxurians FD-317 M1]|uniref:Unplaced genomic scaffold GYMLUscaffold_74, whole genome shotgun sequence n=1 Tax=Collybiopsis luxurians FD-317 M1 TaxID=944289 RepID=A0A0D0CG67_9AGAR|nr:hypothetical protein GYMLUDRAFT_178191 [Collybiopsis luxurians FD-317 M1]
MIPSKEILDRAIQTVRRGRWPEEQMPFGSESFRYINVRTKVIGPIVRTCVVL